MKFSDWLRGVASVPITDVNKVFDVARSAVSAAPFLPANIKADTTQLLNDAQADLSALEGAAGTLVGHATADAVDDVTTLIMNTANVLSNSKSVTDFSAAEKTALQQAWTAMKAQGDTLVSQFMAGVDPVKLTAQANTATAVADGAAAVAEAA